MFLRRPLVQAAVRAGLVSRVSRASGSSSNQPFNAHLCNSNPQMLHSLSGGSEDLIGKTSFVENFGCSLFGRSGFNLFATKVKEDVSLPCALSIRRYIHSRESKESEAGWNSRTANFGSGIVDRSGRNFMGGFQLSPYNVEQNADVVHIKMLRNNTFVTLTDSKGNKKFGISAGKLTDKGGKVSRYAAEACAEQAGRNARDRGIKSIVVKVNGFTYFKKKKQAILGLKEGYSHSRGDKHPVVYVEDTTRRPHNGCRLRKKRRV